MLKKTVVYTNPFTDEEVTEDHYFHISKADLIEMSMEEMDTTYVKDGETLTGMQARLQRIVDSNNRTLIMAEFKDILRRSYGKKEGDRFLKSEEIWQEFVSSEAYSNLFFELCTNAKSAGEFMNGIIPANLEQDVAKIKSANEAPATETPALAKASTALATEEDPTGLTNPGTPRVLTPAEIDDMDSDELKSGLATGRYKIS
jgi:hypothetical protein